MEREKDTERWKETKTERNRKREILTRMEREKLGVFVRIIFFHAFVPQSALLTCSLPRVASSMNLSSPSANIINLFKYSFR